jgi:hypothetical protein
MVVTKSNSSAAPWVFGLSSGMFCRYISCNALMLRQLPGTYIRIRERSNWVTSDFAKFYSALKL